MNALSATLLVYTVVPYNENYFYRYRAGTDYCNDE